MTVRKSAFVAYADKPSEIKIALTAAKHSLNESAKGPILHLWEQNDIPGRNLTAPIKENIINSEFVISDVSVLNFNVTYEIGFAIGSKKRCYLIKNKNIAEDSKSVREVGIFDTLGYRTYQNGSDLRRELTTIKDFEPINVDREKNNSAPLYLVDTISKTDAMVRLISRIKKTRLKYRSFNPEEETRLSAFEAIDHVASSHGVIIPLLSPHISGADVHNLRAAFVAGLSHGLQRPTLIIQDEVGPIPLDIRDLAKRYKHPDQINEHVAELALEATASSARVKESAQTCRQSPQRFGIRRPHG